MAEAWEAFQDWLTGVFERLGSTEGLGRINLNHPEPGREALETGVIDTDLIHLVVSTGQIAGEEVDGLYVGLVAQEPSARWIGLAGFYLPVCPLCDLNGVGPATDRALDIAATLGFEEISHSSVPAGLRPAPGWFDRGRLQAVCRRTMTMARTNWRLWPPTSVEDTFPGYLVRVRPTITTLGGLVLCASREEADGLPEVLGEQPRAWTWSAGEPGCLARASHHSPRVPQRVSPRSRAAYDWWTADPGISDGGKRTLHRGTIPREVAKSDVPGAANLWALSGSGTTTRCELQALLHNPA